MSDRTLALAGAFQAAALTHQVAWSGDCEPSARGASLGSLFELYDGGRASVAELYGGLPGLALGLRTLVQHLGSGAGPRDVAITRYVAGLMHLERKATGGGVALGEIRDALSRVRRQLEHFGLDHETVTGALGEVYAGIVSPLGPRIIVEGESVHLRDSGKAGLIRALLLAGLRAVIAWRQVGGTRIKLLFTRNRTVREAGELLERMEP